MCFQITNLKLESEINYEPAYLQVDAVSGFSGLEKAGGWRRKQEIIAKAVRRNCLRFLRRFAGRNNKS